MKISLPERRKMIELGFLIIPSLILYFVFNGIEIMVLFILGYVWNWTASQNLPITESRKYRFSLLRMVHTLNIVVQKPFKNLPQITKLIPKILPAGLFWMLMILFSESHIPWWPPFLGSFIFELTQFENYLKKTASP